MVNLYAERKRRDISGQDLGAEIGIRRESVSEIERGKIEVTDEWAQRAVEAMDRIVARRG